MASTLADRLASVHPRRLRMSNCDHAAHLAHAKRQAPSVAGPWVGRAFAYAGITPKEASDRTGTALTSIYRWMSGAEQPNFDRLWTLGADFQHGLMQAMGRSCPTATVTEAISWRHSKVGVA